MFEFADKKSTCMYEGGYRSLLCYCCLCKICLWKLDVEIIIPFKVVFTITMAFFSNFAGAKKHCDKKNDVMKLNEPKLSPAKYLQNIVDKYINIPR